MALKVDPVFIPVSKHGDLQHLEPWNYKDKCFFYICLVVTGTMEWILRLSRNSWECQHRIMTFPSYWECQHSPPDFHSMIFQRGRLKPQTSLGWLRFTLDTFIIVRVTWLGGGLNNTWRQVSIGVLPPSTSPVRKTFWVFLIQSESLLDKIDGVQDDLWWSLHIVLVEVLNFYVA